MREYNEIEQEPDEERRELKSFYLQKGLTDEESDLVVNRITTNKKKWLEDLLTNELHIHESELERPLKVASIIGLSFLVGAFVPLVGYIVSSSKLEADCRVNNYLSRIPVRHGGVEGQSFGKKVLDCGTGDVPDRRCSSVTSLHYR